MFMFFKRVLEPMWGEASITGSVLQTPTPPSSTCQSDFEQETEPEVSTGGSGQRLA